MDLIFERDTLTLTPINVASTVEIIFSFASLKVSPDTSITPTSGIVITPSLETGIFLLISFPKVEPQLISGPIIYSKGAGTKSIEQMLWVNL